MDLKRTVPWGRDFNEYTQMFSLISLKPGNTVIGCGDGPASFNAEATAKGINVTSIDPVYQFSKDELAQRINDARDEVMPQVRANPDVFVWTSIKNPDELEHRRMQAMRTFLEDYEKGRRAGRYITASLPSLPFKDNSFDYALCSNFLFLYTPQVDEQQHVDAVLELCRVAKDVRIYPLLSIDNHEKSKHLPAVLSALHEAGYRAVEQAVNYEFQRGANTMLKVSV